MSGCKSLPPAVPVFPLPNVVLFPKALLPLRIFEPRYRAMLRDVLDSHGLIAMALFKPGWEPRYFEKPDVFNMVGVGRVLDYKPDEGETYRIVLLGVQRAEIRGWEEGRPYRLAHLNTVDEEGPPPEEKERLRARLGRHLDRLTQREKVDAASREKIREAVAKAEELGFLVDSIAFHFLSDPREKQILLEVRNTLERERLLREFLLRHSLLVDDESPPEREGSSTGSPPTLPDDDPDDRQD